MYKHSFSIIELKDLGSASKCHILLIFPAKTSRVLFIKIIQAFIDNLGSLV